MSVDGLLLCRSNTPIANAQPLFNRCLSDPSELERRSTRYYDAIVQSNKRLEPHICLCECSVPGESYRHSTDPANSESRHDADVAKPHSGFSDVGCEDCSTPEEISEERGNGLIAWTDDDIDAEDYKNTPDYDPNQDESEYDSRSESELDPSTTSAEPGRPTVYQAAE